MKNQDLQYEPASLDQIEEVGNAFCGENGDDENGIIPDEEYDRLFDHLGTVLKNHGSFSEDSSVLADFNGYRYVDQVPWITIVPGEKIDPRVALAAGLEAVRTAHRPFAVSYDYYPDGLLILPQNRVLTTFPTNALDQGANKSGEETA